MEVGGGAGDSEDETEASEPPQNGALSFFDTAKDDSVGLTFIDDGPLIDDGPVPGESDSDDDDDRSRTSRGRRRKARGKKNHRRIVISMTSCKYDVVAHAARGLGWRCSVD